MIWACRNAKAKVSKSEATVVRGDKTQTSRGAMTAATVLIHKILNICLDFCCIVMTGILEHFAAKPWLDQFQRECRWVASERQATFTSVTGAESKDPESVCGRNATSGNSHQTTSRELPKACMANDAPS